MQKKNKKRNRTIYKQQFCKYKIFQANNTVNRSSATNNLVFRIDLNVPTLYLLHRFYRSTAICSTSQYKLYSKKGVASRPKLLKFQIELLFQNAFRSCNFFIHKTIDVSCFTDCSKPIYLFSFPVSLSLSLRSISYTSVIKRDIHAITTNYCKY